MKKLALITKRVLTENEYGTEFYTWVEAGKAHGIIDIISISKGEQASKIKQDSTHLFITNRIVDVRTGDRLTINDTVYTVNYVDNPMMMNHHLEIELKETLEQVNQTDKHIYFGTTDNEDIVEIDILNFQNKVLKEKLFTTTFKGTDTKLVIAYPKDFGKSSIRINEKLITNWNIKELMVNGNTHYVYSVDVEIGNLKIDLF